MQFTASCLPLVGVPGLQTEDDLAAQTYLDVVLPDVTAAELSREDTITLRPPTNLVTRVVGWFSSNGWQAHCPTDDGTVVIRVRRRPGMATEEALRNLRLGGVRALNINFQVGAA